MLIPMLSEATPGTIEDGVAESLNYVCRSMTSKQLQVEYKCPVCNSSVTSRPMKNVALSAIAAAIATEEVDDEEFCDCDWDQFFDERE